MNMSPTAPRLSVLMAVHDARRYLDACLRSIFGQTFADFEFIVVDDGSTDGSRRILEKWARRDARLRLIARENRGLTPSLNEALAAARGEYVARMDADDVSLPRRFELQVDYLDRHADCVAVGGEVLMVDPEGWPIGLRGHALTHEEIDRRLLAANGGALTHPVATMRADALRKIGGYREQFVVAQDLDLFLRLAEVGRLANLPEVLLRWRQSPRSINFTRYQSWGEMKRMALRDAAARRGIVWDVEAILAQDQFPFGSRTPRLTWGRYALNAGHPWTALKNGCASFGFEPDRAAAKNLIGDACSRLYWRGFRSKFGRQARGTRN